MIRMMPNFRTLCSLFVLLLAENSVLAWKFSSLQRIMHKTVLPVIVSIGISAASAHALEVQYKLPPIDFKDKMRCQLVSSSMGQANAARDKLYDLRQCDLKGQTAAGKDLSGMIAADADFSTVNFKEAQLSKAYAKNGKFADCDFTNAIVDRAVFDGTNLQNSIFVNAVLSGTTFTDANLKNTDFTDAYLGPFDLKRLCENPSLEGKNPKTNVDTKESAGCL